jgi:hypothetical protein
VQGGVVGENPTIPSNATYQDNLEWKVDFRSVYSAVFDQWLCVDNAELNNVMLRDFDSHQVIKDGFACISTSVHEEHLNAGKSCIKIYPSPFRDQVSFEFESIGSDLQIQIIDTAGRIIAVPVRGRYAQGSHLVQWNGSQLIAGNYFVRFMSEGVVQTKGMVKL